MGSGKGYLSSFLSLRYGLCVYGIDSSSTNTHGAQERNRKLKKFSRVYQRHNKAARDQSEATHPPPEENRGDDVGTGAASQQDELALTGSSDANCAAEAPSESNSETEELFLSSLSVDLLQAASSRLPPSQLSAEERERRKRQNLERKARNRTNSTSALFSPLTSYVTAETELRELINELEVKIKSMIPTAAVVCITEAGVRCFCSAKAAARHHQ